MEIKELIKKIEEKRRIPEEIKDDIIKEIHECILCSILAYVYFIFLKLGAKNIHQSIFLTDLKVFAISAVVVAVAFFENSYREKNNKLLYRGLELLSLGLITVFLQYVTVYLAPQYMIMIPAIAILYNIYFVLKAILISNNIKNKYNKSQNDIKEIVKNNAK